MPVDVELRQQREVGVELCTFVAEVTPPLGDGVGIGFMRETLSIEHPLLAKGVVIRDARGTCVLCALDYCGLCNDAFDLFRRKIAEAAGTNPQHVAVQSLHQHTAPVLDADARRILYRDDPVALARGLDFVELAAQRVADAVYEACTSFRLVTHVGTSRARVDRLASSRRIEQPDGSIVTRSSSTRDPELRAAPEGPIDPWVRTVAFFDGEEPLVHMQYYATHPQSFYGDGRISYDVPGIARERLQAETGVFQIYFTGCGGDVAFGKYNDGTPEARSQLTERLYDGLVRASQHFERAPITPITWQVQTLSFPLRDEAEFSAESALRIVGDPESSFSARLKAAMNLAWIERVLAGREVTLSCLSVGPVDLIHLPGEPFVAFQLFAQQAQPDRFVAVAGYGECAMWYIGPDRIYTDRGGYEQSWSFGGRVEAPLKQTITEFLGASADR